MKNPLRGYGIQTNDGDDVVPRCWSLYIAVFLVSLLAAMSIAPRQCVASGCAMLLTIVAVHSHRIKKEHRNRMTAL